MLLYNDLNEVEKRIVDTWVKEGMTQEQALKELEDSLLDCDGDMDL